MASSSTELSGKDDQIKKIYRRWHEDNNDPDEREKYGCEMD
jgi:hypothetical protein